MKRLFDVVVAGMLLLLTLPLCALIAALVALELREPPVYGSKRVGKDGVLFAMFRFRTMRLVTRPSASQPSHQLTRVGAVIRNYSLDDLPGLLNVLLGDMSLIGPRPMEPAHVDLADPQWRRIVTVRPGMISYAVLTLARSYNASPIHRKQQLELAYLARRSRRFDGIVFARALRALLRSRGNIKARGVPDSE